MNVIDCQISMQRYPIYIGHSSDYAPAFNTHIQDKALMIIVDSKVPFSFYQPLESLPNRKVWLTVEVGEQNKSLAIVEHLWQQLLAHGFDRHSLLISIGGGVLGDMVGFCAACFMRGMPWLNVPTTLMAQVDAAIGGKTGINFAGIKNVIGAFHHPSAVFSDPSVLLSLSETDFRSGLAEVVKYGIAFNASFLTWLEQHCELILARDLKTLETMITQCTMMKVNVVAQDAFDFGARHSLNLGHTFAHAIESAEQFQGLTHGQAVSIGLRLALGLGEACFGLNSTETIRVSNLLQRFGLPIWHPSLTSASLKPYLYKDKKKCGQELCFVVPKQLGEVTIVRKLDEKLLDDMIHAYAT